MSRFAGSTLGLTPALLKGKHQRDKTKTHHVLIGVMYDHEKCHESIRRFNPRLDACFVEKSPVCE